jgi:hypothetical protein
MHRAVRFRMERVVVLFTGPSLVEPKFVSRFQSDRDRACHGRTFCRSEGQSQSYFEFDDHFLSQILTMQWLEWLQNDDIQRSEPCLALYNPPCGPGSTCHSHRPGSLAAAPHVMFTIVVNLTWVSCISWRVTTLFPTLSYPPRIRSVTLRRLHQCWSSSPLAAFPTD